MVEVEEECRLTDMAPETVCMLVAWVQTRSALELRAMCWTLKRAVDEVAPWKMRRKRGPFMFGTPKLWSLVATDANVMRRTVLHAPRRVHAGGTLLVEMAAKMGSVAVIKIMQKEGCRMNGEVCRRAKEHRHKRVLHWLHSGAYRTWPCSREPCRWALQHVLSQ